MRETSRLSERLYWEGLNGGEEGKIRSCRGNCGKDELKTVQPNEESIETVSSQNMSLVEVAVEEEK